VILRIEAVGLVSPLGEDAAALLAPVAGAGLRPHAPLAALPGGDAAGWVDGPNLRPWLRRRKDKKVMARPSQLALAAAGPAMVGHTGDPMELGLFLGVGREPPDSGESEPALAAAATEGVLDESRLAGPGRDLYPPLLPLKTLPNMALAHISINLGVMGENNAWAGDVGAGMRAVVSGVHAVREGRSPAALVGGADSLVDLGSARDRLRRGGTGAPGEAAAVLRIAPWDGQTPGVGLDLEARDPDALAVDPVAMRAAIGDTGAAEGPLLIAAAADAVARDGRARIVRLADPGQPAVAVRVHPLPGA
jgi:hypothetical protein